jgi:hypothetical protein
LTCLSYTENTAIQWWMWMILLIIGTSPEDIRQTLRLEPPNKIRMQQYVHTHIMHRWQSVSFVCVKNEYRENQELDGDTKLGMIWKDSNKRANTDTRLLLKGRQIRIKNSVIRRPILAEPSVYLQFQISLLKNRACHYPIGCKWYTFETVYSYVMCLILKSVCLSWENRQLCIQHSTLGLSMSQLMKWISTAYFICMVNYL